jgi:hypothetical protein
MKIFGKTEKDIHGYKTVKINNSENIIADLVVYSGTDVKVDECTMCGRYCVLGDDDCSNGRREYMAKTIFINNFYDKNLQLIKLNKDDKIGPVSPGLEYNYNLGENTDEKYINDGSDINGLYFYIGDFRSPNARFL